jgi:hypothetical protein
MGAAPGYCPEVWASSRGVRAGIVRIRGLAPDGLSFALGPLSFEPGELATAPA